MFRERLRKLATKWRRSGYRSTTVDLLTREASRIEFATPIPGDRAVRLLAGLGETHGISQRITCDKGPEFLSTALSTRVVDRGIELNYIDPEKPIQNCIVTSSNGTFRGECLNEH